MRPQILSMSAFGPYAEVQHIHFNELENRSIFLIHGPTGAGKTTILDAICFALYGDTSGSERNSKNMRSHHANVEQQTWVEFTFRLREETYRIQRKPEQERLKKSGDGITVQLPEAVLWKISAKEDQKEEILQTGWKNVTEEIERLIGFKSDQFRQVIMLPQGEFRKLLTSDSVEREKILEKLFQTELYRRIEEFLKGNANELKREIKDLQSKQEWYFSKTETDTIEALEALIQSDEKKLEIIRMDLKQITETVKSTQTEYLKGKEGNEKILEREISEQELNRLQTLIPMQEKMKNDLIKARLAATLTEREKSVRLRSLDKEQSEKDLELTRRTLEEAIKHHEAADLQLQNELNKEEEREQVKKKLLQFEEYKDKVTSLDEVRNMVVKLRKDAETANQEMESLKVKLQESEKKIEAKKLAVEEAKEAALKKTVYQSKFDEIKRFIHQKEQLEAFIQDLKSITGQTEKNLKKYEEAEEEYLRAKKEWFALQEMWNRGQAAILADHLEEGAPCPVCGSTDHPHLAVKAEWIPTEQEMKEKQTFVEAREKAKDQFKDQFNKTMAEKEKLEAAIKSIVKELGVNEKEDLQRLRESMEQIKKEMDASIQLAERLEIEANLLQDAVQEKKNIEAQLKGSEQKASDLNQQYLKAEGAFKEKERSIPEEIRSLESLTKVYTQTKELNEYLRQQLELVKNQFDAADKGLTAAMTAKDRAEKVYEETVKKYQDERNEFKASLKTAEFETYQEYEAAKKDEQEIRNLEQEIKDFEARLRSTEDRLNRAVKSAESFTKVDIEDLQHQLTQAEMKREEILKIENTLLGKIKSFKEMMEDIHTLDQTIKEKEKEYEIIGDLAKVSNGDNSYGLTFQRFILGALLDDITIAATERLKIMSKGRYHLRRTMDRARKNAAGGLELEVFDTYTGIQRPVTTLSGGETFIASLSLALGLADVVQSYAGGISLDTIFVDEGFGTLDPESLDFAVKTLIDLQKDGRLVGIISHVPELKERIDARLEVVSTGKGSMAKFNIR